MMHTPLHNFLHVLMQDSGSLVVDIEADNPKTQCDHATPMHPVMERMHCSDSFLLQLECREIDGDDSCNSLNGSFSTFRRDKSKRRWDSAPAPSARSRTADAANMLCPRRLPDHTDSMQIMRKRRNGIAIPKDLITSTDAEDTEDGSISSNVSQSSSGTADSFKNRLSREEYRQLKLAAQAFEELDLKRFQSDSGVQRSVSMPARPRECVRTFQAKRHTASGRTGLARTYSPLPAGTKQQNREKDVKLSSPSRLRKLRRGGYSRDKASLDISPTTRACIDELMLTNTTVHERTDLNLINSFDSTRPSLRPRRRRCTANRTPSFNKDKQDSFDYIDSLIEDDKCPRLPTRKCSLEQVEDKQHTTPSKKDNDVAASDKVETSFNQSVNFEALLSPSEDITTQQGGKDAENDFWDDLNQASQQICEELRTGGLPNRDGNNAPVFAASAAATGVDTSRSIISGHSDVCEPSTSIVGEEGVQKIQLQADVDVDDDFMNLLDRRKASSKVKSLKKASTKTSVETKRKVRKAASVE